MHCLKTGYLTSGKISQKAGRWASRLLSLTLISLAFPAATQEAGSVEAANTHSSATEQRVLEEVLVTANHRVQNVQNIASGIRVLDGEALEKSGVSGMDDYIFKVPGLDLIDSGMEKKIAIRGIGNVAGGISAGGSASPIGLYLNDTPIQGNGVLPDLTLYDLERIEVLKGPQGTLYGEGAQGGAIKMLLAKADPAEFTIKGEATSGRTKFADEPNRSQALAANIPLGDSWAVRLVGSRRVNAGYIDFPNRGTMDENKAENTMSRLHLDGSIRSDLQLSAMLLHQQQSLDQFPQVQKEDGDLRNRNGEPQFSEMDFKLAALTLDLDLSFAQLTSSTSAFSNDRQALGRAPFIGALTFIFLNPIFGSNVEETPGPGNEWTETDNLQYSIAQEIRLVSIQESWIDWVGGVFYRKRKNEFNYIADNDMSDEPPPIGPGIYEFKGYEAFKQIAGFGEVTLDLPWDLELNAGVRIFRETAELVGQGWGRGPLYPLLVLGSGSTEGTPGERSFDITTTEVTPKVSLSWFIDDFRMLYLLAAEGVRSGGTNPNALATTVTPLFEPDTLRTYELGAKTQWLDGRLTANLALFYNDWTDLQVFTTQVASIGPVPTAMAVVLNVGRAVSRGAELEFEALPYEGLTIGLQLSMLDGEIVEGDSSGVVADGAALPQTPKLSYAASLRYDALHWSIFGATPFVSIDTQRTGDRVYSPPSTIASPEMEGFQLYGVMAGFTHESWDLSFGVRNLTDERPELGANLVEMATKTIGPPRTWTARIAFRY